MRTIARLAATALISLGGSALAGGDADKVGARPNLGTVVSTIQASRTEAGKIRNLSNIATVEVVEVSELTGSENAHAEFRAVENAVSRNELDVDEMRAAIESNAELSTELASRSVVLENVIAAKVEADGKVVIFVRPS